jgi:hypothetical protein
MNKDNSPQNDKNQSFMQVEQAQNKSLDSDSLPKKDDQQTEAEINFVDEQWAELSQDWQSQPFTKVDVNALLKQTKKRTYLAKSLLGLDILATLGLVIAFIVGIYQGDWKTATLAYLAFGSILSIVFVYYEIKIRLKIWQQSCDSPDEAIDNAIAGCQSSIKYIQLIKLSCWLLLPAVNAYIYAMLTESEKSPWPPFIMINSFVLIMWGITHYFHKKRNVELKQLMGYKSK